MSQFAEPTRTLAPKAPDQHRPAMAAAKPGRCLGAAAQLAAVRRTLASGLPLQLKTGGTRAASQAAGSPGQTSNRTGLPDRLKAGVETLSGLAMDDVRVHRNSPEPARLDAHAFTQGSDIHLGPGQEQHLPHEAWHVVQQKQGRVHPTVQRMGLGFNVSTSLESEAEVKGAEAMQLARESAHAADALRPSSASSEACAHPVAGSRSRPKQSKSGSMHPVQMKLKIKTEQTVFRTYTDELDRIVSSIASAYSYTSRKMKEWFSDDKRRIFSSVSSVVETIEESVKTSIAAISSVKEMDIDALNQDVDNKELKRRMEILRGPDFKQGLLKAMAPLIYDYGGPVSELVDRNIVSRITAYASKELKVGNCEEFAYVVFWKMMELDKGHWVGTAKLHPNIHDADLAPGVEAYDHTFNILSSTEFGPGVNPCVGHDAIIIDAWDNYKLTTLAGFLKGDNPYGKVFTMDNINVEKVEPTLGYEILDSQLKKAADAATQEFLEKRGIKAETK